MHTEQAPDGKIPSPEVIADTEKLVSATADRLVESVRATLLDPEFGSTQVRVAGGSIHLGNGRKALGPDGTFNTSDDSPNAETRIEFYEKDGQSWVFIRTTDGRSASVDGEPEEVFDHAEATLKLDDRTVVPRMVEYGAGFDELFNLIGDPNNYTVDSLVGTYKWGFDADSKSETGEKTTITHDREKRIYYISWSKDGKPIAKREGPSSKHYYADFGIGPSSPDYEIQRAQALETFDAAFSLTDFAAW